MDSNSDDDNKTDGNCYGKNLMFPTKELEGADLQLLKDELDGDFLLDPDNREAFDKGEVDPLASDTGENLFKFSGKVGGLQWLNAVHQLEDPETESHYSWNSVDDIDQETWQEIQDEEELVGGKYTPLTYILNKDPSESWRTVRLLIDVGADPNLRDARGHPPLYYAILGEGMGPRWKVVHILLEAGANALAIHRGKSLAAWAKDWAKEDRNGPRQMIWDSIKTKLGLPDDKDDAEGDY